MKTEEYLKKIDEVNAAGAYRPAWESLCAHETPDWFRNAKFGIFVHWGVFTVPEAFNEWYPRHMYREGSPEHAHFLEKYGDMKHFGYKDLVPLFTAPRFSAKEWLDLFEEAGAKYLTPVAEHHDGFKMYRSELSRWNCVQMGPKRDVLGELKAEAERRGLVFCASSHRAEHYWFMNGGRTFDSDVNDPAFDDFYGPAQYSEDLKDACPRDLYSLTADSPRMREHCENWLARTAELADRYRPSMIYFDWWINHPAFRPYLKKFTAYYYNRAKEWGKQVTVCYKHNAYPPDAATFDVERGQLSGIRMRPWQTDTAIAVNSWCYTDGNQFKKPEDIAGDLVDIVSKNGCLMLNVGPRADGSICAEEAAVLRALGKWLKINGEGIYGTSCWKTYGEGPTEIPEGQFCDTVRAPFTPQDVRYTCKNEFIYVFVMSAKDGIDGADLHALAGGDIFGEAVNVEQAEVLGHEDVRVRVTLAREATYLRFDKSIRSDYPVCVRLKTV